MFPKIFLSFGEHRHHFLLAEFCELHTRETRERQLSGCIAVISSERRTLFALSVVCLSNEPATSGVCKFYSLSIFQLLLSPLWFISLSQPREGTLLLHSR